MEMQIFYSKNGGKILKKTKFGFALASLALLGASAFANKITLNGKEFDSIQSALDSISDSGSYNIVLEPGVYNEVLYYKGPADIKISGKTSKKYGSDVVISECNDGDLYKQKRAASAQNGRCIFEFEGTGNLTFENLTMENTYSRKTGKGSNTQAETIGFDSTGNLAAYNCAFKSHQDTLRMTGKSWFYDCYVEGDTDFIWMEAKGVVALFENCEIKALFDEKSQCIIGAPRMNYGTKAGKGLVIYNSKIYRDDTPKGEVEQSYALARTPWNSGYYNQVAYVNDDLRGVNQTLWQGDPLLAEGVAKTTIGWKIDEATLKTLGVDAKGRDDVLSKKEISSEYSGRRAILNRVFDFSRNAFRKDYESNWKIDEFIRKNGWNVAADKSKELASGEKEAAISVYDFSKDVSSYPDLSVKGFENASGVNVAKSEVPYIVGNEGSEISFKVASKSLVTVYGLFSGKAEISLGSQGSGILDFNNGSKVAEKACAYVVYEKKGTVKIKALGKTCISKIIVETDPKIAFVPVKSISVTSKDGATELKARAKLQMFATLNPVLASNRDYVWSVSDEKTASINEFGVLRANANDEDKIVTVTATSRDSKKVSGSAQIKILKVNPNEFTATWFGSIESSKTFEGESDNSAVASVGKAVPFGKTGKWACNTSKFNASFSDGGISYEGFPAKIEGDDKIYVDFPFTAMKDLQIKSIAVSFGNHGTSNIGVLFSVIRNGEAEEIMDDTTRKCRQIKKVYDDEGLLDTIEVAAGETITLRIQLYGYNGSEIDIAKGKAPTIGTVQLSGLAK